MACIIFIILLKLGELATVDVWHVSRLSLRATITMCENCSTVTTLELVLKYDSENIYKTPGRTLSHIRNLHFDFEYKQVGLVLLHPAKTASDAEATSWAYEFRPA